MSDPNEIALGRPWPPRPTNVVLATRAVPARVQSFTNSNKCKRGDPFGSPLSHLVEAAGTVLSL